MKQIYFATKNKGKVNYVDHILSKYRIKVIQVPMDLPEPRTNDLQDIARQKVLFAYEQIKRPCIALDAGFYIHVLNGFPRTFVNFVLDTIRVEGILKLVNGKSRLCEFRNCLAYYDDSLENPIFFKFIEKVSSSHLDKLPKMEFLSEEIKNKYTYFQKLAK